MGLLSDNMKFLTSEETNHFLTGVKYPFYLFCFQLIFDYLYVNILELPTLTHYD